jgi:pimeloyl-ACP methyl ester carboxylesterase
MNKFIVFSKVCFVLSLSLGFSSAQSPAFELSECLFTPPKDQLVGRTFECGYVRVPENRNQPGNQTVRLHAIRFKSLNSNLQRKALMLLNGGPGASSQALVNGIRGPAKEALQSNSDVVIFDQRGIGFSEPSTSCAAELNSVSSHLRLIEQSKQEVKAMEACRVRLTAQGIDLAAYNTAENAEDVNAVRLALGYGRIDLLGISYGTRLALETMRRHPEAVRTLVIDSVFPPEAVLSQNAASNIDRALSLVFRLCQSDSSCRSRYPNLEQRFTELVSQLNSRPLSVTLLDETSKQNVAHAIDGDLIVILLTEMLNSSASKIPALIQSIEKKDFRIFNQLISGATGVDPLDGQGMRFTILCGEDLPRFKPNKTQVGRPEVHKAVNMMNLDQWQKVCANWPVQNAVTSTKPVTSEVPALVFSGQLDPVTPPTYGRSAARTLKNSFFFEFPAVGHVAMNQGNGCAFGVLVRFLKDPMTRPEAPCAKRLKLEFH